MFKKIQIIFMVSILFIGILPSFGLEAKAADPVIIDGFSYELTEDEKGVIITGYYDSSSIAIIPNEIEGKPVVEIGYQAFFESDITGITIPDSVTGIGRSAFEGTMELTSIEIPNSVTWIDSSAFERATALTNIEIPNSVTWIGWSAFEGATALKSITLPDGLKNIKESTFANATALTSIEIPNSVTIIENSVFSGATGLTSITLPNDLKDLGDSVFANATALMSITLPNSVKSIGNSAFANVTGLTSIEIPNSVKSIGNNAFEGVTSLKSIKFHTPVTSLGGDVFKNVPNGLEVIGFKDSKIEKYVKVGNSSTPGKYIFEGAEYEITAKDFYYTLINNGQEVVIEEYNNASLIAKIPSEIDGKPVVRIGERVFKDSEITEVTIPDSVTSIGNSAFSGATGLTNITLPNGLKDLGDSVFANATGLTSLTLPNGLKNLGDSEFANATGLTSIEIPNSVKSIGDNAFEGATSLKSIKFHTPATSLGEDIFKNVPNGLEVIGFKNSKLERYVQNGNASTPGKYIFEGLEYEITAKDFDYTLTGNKEGIIITGYNDNISLTPIIPNEIEGKPVVEIGYQAFFKSDITGITIPDSVTTIREFAFGNSKELTTVRLPNSLENIENFAFEGAAALTSIEIPSSVKYLGKHAFKEATSLKSIKFHTPATILGSNVFEDVPNGLNIIGFKGSGLERYVQNGNASTPGKYIFEGLEYEVTAKDFEHKLTEDGEGVIITGYSDNISLKPVIPSEIDGKPVVEIGSSVFDKSAITEITIPNSVTSIGYSAFSGATGLTSITLPTSLKSIGDYAFFRVSGLTSIEIPNSVESIGNSAFYGMPGLTSLTLPTSLKRIGDYAFEGATGLTSMEIPNSVESIGDSAFAEMTGLTSLTLPNSLESIGSSVFYRVIGLTSLEIPNSVESIGDYAFSEMTGLTSLTLPNSLEGIGEGAFYGMTGLTSMEIPNSVKYIGSHAFKEVTSLKNIKINSQLWFIGGDIFSGIPDGLKVVGFKGSNLENYINESNKESAGRFIFTGLEYKPTAKDFSYELTKDRQGLIITGYNENISLTPKIPSEIDGKPVVEIGEYAFYESEITGIKIPNSVKTVGEGAFQDARSLTTVEIPNGVEAIGDQAFEDARSLMTITLPNTLKHIGKAAFEDAKVLKSIEIPISVETIGDYAFEDMDALKTIKFYNPLTTLGKDVFYDVPKGLKVIGFKGSKLEAYIKDGNEKSPGKFIFEALNKVTFDSVEGTDIAPVILEGKTKLTEPKAPTKKNHVFEGWYTDAKYKTKWDFKTVVEKDLTLYAKWSINKQVTFNSDGGTKIASVYAGYKKPIAQPKAPTKANHVFEGWYTDKDHKTKWDFKKVVEKDLTLYAKWSINKQVTFNSDGGTKIASVKVDSGKAIIAPKAPTKKNHVFEGWYTDAKYKTKWDFKKVVEKDLTLYAKWTFVAPVITLKNSTNISDVTVQVTGTTSPNSAVRIVQGSKEIGKGKSDAKGNFTIKISKVKANSAVEIQVTDTYGTKKSFKKTVADKTAPKVTVPKVNAENTKIVGTAEAKSKIELVINKKVTKATTSSKGNYSISIKKQKAGTKMTLTVSDAAGNKTTKIITVLAAPKPVTLASINDKQDTITGKTEAKAKVAIYVNDKSVKTVTANSKGTYTYKVGKKKAGTSIKVIATDQAGNTTTKTVKVLDKTAPGKPTVNSVKASSTTVVGKAEAGSTVSVYKGKTYLGKATTSSKGNYTVKIKKQAKGTTLLVKAQDKAKNTSKNTSVKVK